LQIEIVETRGHRTTSTKLVDVSPSSSIADVKTSYHRIKPALYPDRQSYKTELRGKTLKDSDTLQGIGLAKGGKLYFKDLGPQVGWTTVFLTEYAGPLLIYLFFYSRPSLIYGEQAANTPRHLAVQVACVCWTFHYGKRLLETIFVHRFSHGTMPILNIFKNSGYYWGFAAFVAYFNNHPLYTPPSFGLTQLYAGLVAFLFCELGNFSIHVALRNLRPAGSKERRIPLPTGNPLTALFNFVSCPNYTYEVGAWFSFSVMSQSLPALLFAIVGFGQMTIWALGKHKIYKHDFKDYPRGRKAIIPFII
jgi:very-long-chain enoyl-CoA reductase